MTGTRAGLPPAHLAVVPPWGEFGLVVHGGAGIRPEAVAEDERRAALAGLARSLEAGREVLAAGGTAEDAVSAAVVVLEDCELFNAGRGAALTTAGTAELDAALMTGEGTAGAVVTCRTARNPVLAARAVMEQTPHVLLVDPTVEQLAGWGLDVVEAGYHVTQRRRADLAAALREQAPQHGTVGAVARDRCGRLAAATSTGGINGQLPGRVGDAPIIGAGTWADAGTCAVSCTGHGEYFLRASAAHDIHARMRYAGADLVTAVRGTLDELVGARGGDGGLIALGADGTGVLAFNSPGMYRGWVDADGVHTAVGRDG